MLNVDFNNGKKLNLLTALALFTVVMGFLFLIAASPGVSTIAAVCLIAFGAIWLIVSWLFELRHHHTSH